jgi:hypothetical protein
MKDKVIEFNSQQKDLVIERLENQVKDLEPKELIKDSDIDILINLVEPVAVDLWEAEGKEAAKLVGFDDFDVLTPQTKKAIKKAVSLLGENYNDYTRKLLIEKLTEGQEQGYGLFELKNIVLDIYDYNDQVRAEMVAKTETFRIGNEANRNTWKDTGVVKSIKWYTAGADICEFCQELSGKEIAIEESFFNKGDSVDGNDGGTMEVTYSDVDAPPLHPNCKCYIRPEVISIN